MTWGRRHRNAQEPELNEEQEPWSGESWEYLVEDGDLAADHLEDRCNQLGAEGWELVAVVPLSRPSLTTGGRTTGSQLFFKRLL